MFLENTPTLIIFNKIEAIAIQSTSGPVLSCFLLKLTLVSELVNKGRRLAILIDIVVQEKGKINGINVPVVWVHFFLTCAS